MLLNLGSLRLFILSRALKSIENDTSLLIGLSTAFIFIFELTLKILSLDIDI